MGKTRRQKRKTYRKTKSYRKTKKTRRILKQRGGVISIHTIKKDISVPKDEFNKKYIENGYLEQLFQYKYKEKKSDYVDLYKCWDRLNSDEVELSRLYTQSKTENDDFKYNLYELYKIVVKYTNKCFETYDMFDSDADGEPNYNHPEIRRNLKNKQNLSTGLKNLEILISKIESNKNPSVEPTAVDADVALAVDEQENTPTSET